MERKSNSQGETKMNKWINILIIGVLVVGLAASLFFYFQESGNLKDAQDVIVNLEGDISTLDGIVSTLGTDLAAAEAEVTRLEEDLAAAEGQVTTLETDLAAAEGQVSVLEGNVSTLETDLAAAEGQVTTLETDLAAAEAQVSTLEAELADAEAQVATLAEELAKVKDPRHFTSLQELEAWLAQDDTDTAYPFLSTAELAFILQVRALRDGYLLPAEVYAGGVGLNVAYIGSDIYLVSPEDDFTIWWDTMDSLPSHPLPLS
jgi:predicted  nucleic acid-binding Zn-ribbon protein